jgi:hypothetical protein
MKQAKRFLMRQEAKITCDGEIDRAAVPGVCLSAALFSQGAPLVSAHGLPPYRRA